MKKWFAVFCLSIVGTAAFAQIDPHAKLQGNVLDQQRAISDINERLSEVKGNDPHAVDLKVAIEHQVAQAQAQQTPHWPQADQYHAVQQPVKTSDRPSYYMGDDTWFTCKEVDVCESWAREQAQKDMHFLILSAQISLKEDRHNQRLEVHYLANFAENKQVFEEDFNSDWKEVK